MKILMATSEAVPFAKTGGLADVCGALPVELEKLGHEPIVIMPAYHQIRAAGMPIEPTGIHFEVPIGSKSVAGSLLKSHLPNSSVPVYLVNQDHYFNRPGLYQENGQDYKDNCERFVFFSRAVLECDSPAGFARRRAARQRLADGADSGLFENRISRRARLRADRHAVHDSQHGLPGAVLALGHAADRAGLEVLQLAADGVLRQPEPAQDGADRFADRLNTVSPRYAEEIQTAPLGCGLEGVLQNRRDALSGIINGVDYREWDPQSDGNLPDNFSADTIAVGKAACKAALQSSLGLTVAPKVPLVAFIGRLTEQKGVDLLIAAMRDWVQSHDAQWIVLGTGDASYQSQLTMLAERFPQKVAVRLEFSNRLAHRIEAGADMFLMPSRYEPCGLNQLYSLKYGTVPVVRATGGLVDTITDLSEKTLAAGTATGFQFGDYSALALTDALQRACNTYANGETWKRLVHSGMQQDWSWTASARQYVDTSEPGSAAGRR